jgi:hypothetical protein
MDYMLKTGKILGKNDNDNSLGIDDKYHYGSVNPTGGAPSLPPIIQAVPSNKSKA